MSVLRDKLDALIQPVVDSMNLCYWGCVVQNANGHLVVRVYIDREGGVTIDDCAAVSRSLSAVLDVEESVLEKYSLEVSSPGLDRPLLRHAHYVTCVEKAVTLTLYEPINEQRTLRGVLAQVGEDAVVLRCDGIEYKVMFKQIKRANLNASVRGK